MAQKYLPEITYTEIRDALITEFKKGSVSNKQVENHLSIFRQWLIFFNKTERDIASEFESFDDNFELFIKKKGYSDSSIPSRKYWLKKFHKKYLRLTLYSNLPSSFHERLDCLVKSTGLSRSKVAKKAGIKQQTFNAWCIGQQRPHKKQISVLFKIEKILESEKGVLVDTIKYWYGDGAHNEKRPINTVWAELQSIRQKSNYRLHYINWPRKLKNQWQDLKKHHTALKTPVLPRHSWAIWDKASTILSRRRFFEYFFGFLILPKRKGGFGFRKTDLHMGLLSIVNEDGSLKYFDPFIDFRKSRTICDKWPNGVYTNTVKRDLKILAVFLNGKNGYFVNSPAFKSLDPQNGLTWDGNCHKAMDRIVALIKGTQFEQVRFPEDPIDFIIDDQHPIRYLKLFVDNMEKDMPPIIQKSYDRRFVNWHFVCSFLSAIPLRASMIARMKLDTNLYKDTDNLWRVKFEPKDFKNHKGAAKDRKYDVLCPMWLQPIIDRYIEFRKHYPGGGITKEGKRECEYVIRPAVNNGVWPQKHLPVDKETIYRWCIKATSLYISGCLGFGPHAWRHIIATDWIKNHPNGFQVAARILHDRYKTVKANYEHLETADWLLHYNQYLDTHFLSSRQSHTSKRTQTLSVVDHKNSGLDIELQKERDRNGRLQKVIENQMLQLENLQKSVHNLTQLLASNQNRPAA